MYKVVHSIKRIKIKVVVEHAMDFFYIGRSKTNSQDHDWF